MSALGRSEQSLCCESTALSLIFYKCRFLKKRRRNSVNLQCHAVFSQIIFCFDFDVKSFSYAPHTYEVSGEVTCEATRGVIPTALSFGVW